MTKIINVGVIGSGSIAQRNHIPGLSPEGSLAASMAVGGYQYGGCADSQVIAIADINRDKADKVAARFSIPKVYDDWRKLIEDPEVDAVTVATPNYIHAEMVIAAAKAGKHVLVEKPMATTVEDADLMIATAEKAGVVLMVDQTERFVPAHEMAKEIISSGIIGKIGSVRTRSSHQGPEFWSPGSTWFFEKEKSVYGAMFDLGIHKLDLIRWLIGDEVEEVAGFSDTLFKQNCEVEDHAVAVLRFSKGTLGVLEAAWSTDPADANTSIYGSEGNIKLGGNDPIVLEFPSRQALIFNFKIPDGSLDNSNIKPIVPSNSKLGGPFRHFIDCIKTGKQPLTDGHEARASLAVILAALESAKLHQYIKLK